MPCNHGNVILNVLFVKVYLKVYNYENVVLFVRAICEATMDVIRGYATPVSVLELSVSFSYLI